MWGQAGAPRPGVRTVLIVKVVCDGLHRVFWAHRVGVSPAPRRRHDHLKLYGALLIDAQCAPVAALSRKVEKVTARARP